MDGCLTFWNIINTIYATVVIPPATIIFIREGFNPNDIRAIKTIGTKQKKSGKRKPITLASLLISFCMEILMIWIEKLNMLQQR